MVSVLLENTVLIDILEPCHEGNDKLTSCCDHKHLFHVPTMLIFVIRRYPPLLCPALSDRRYLIGHQLALDIISAPGRSLAFPFTAFREKVGNCNSHHTSKG